MGTGERNGPGMDRLAVGRVKFGHGRDLGGVGDGVLENKACQRGKRK
jgi:hypothetical protein